MYGKYTLFYESPKNWEYYAHVQTVCTRPLLGRGGVLGMRLGDSIYFCIWRHWTQPGLAWPDPTQKGLAMWDYRSNQGVSDSLSNILYIYTCRWGWSPRCDFSSEGPCWEMEGPWYLSGGATKWPWHHPIKQPPLFWWLPKGNAVTVAETELQCMSLSASLNFHLYMSSVNIKS